VWWIRQSIFSALAEQSRIVRLPLNRVGNLNKIRKKFYQLEQEFEREPTAIEIADQLNMNVNEVVKTIKMSGKQLSVDAPIVQGEDSKLLDVLPNEQQPPYSELMLESLKIEIQQALTTLSPREAEVIKLFFGLDGMHSSLEEIAEKFNLTRERVRQIKEKAIRRLRHESRSNALRSYLG